MLGFGDLPILQDFLGKVDIFLASPLIWVDPNKHSIIWVDSVLIECEEEGAESW